MQEIITYIIITAAVLHVITKVAMSFRDKSNSNSGCNGCSKECSACSIPEGKNEVESN